MLIKLDHISCIVNKKNLEEKQKELLERGYTLKFKEIDLPNISNKNIFMSNTQVNHSLYYYERKGKISIELIVYNTVAIGNQLYKRNEIWELNVENIQETKKLLLSLGTAVMGTDTINIGGALDKAPTLILLKKIHGEGRKAYLDGNGFGCPTFLVSSLMKTRENLKICNMVCSNIEEAVINGVKLYIFFASTGAQEIIVEVISNRL